MVVIEGSQVRLPRVILPPGSSGTVVFENRDADDYLIIVRTRPGRRLELPAGQSVAVDFSQDPPDRYQVTLQIGNARSIVTIDTRAATAGPQEICGLAEEIATAHAEVEARLDEVAALLEAETTAAGYLDAYREIAADFAVSGGYLQYAEGWTGLGPLLGPDAGVDAATVATWAEGASQALRSDWPGQALDRLTADPDGATTAAANRLADQVEQQCDVLLLAPPGLGDPHPIMAALEATNGLVEPFDPDRAAWLGTLDYLVERPDGTKMLATVQFDTDFVRGEGAVADVTVLTNETVVAGFELAYGGAGRSYIRQPGRPWAAPDDQQAVLARGLTILDPSLGFRFLVPTTWLSLELAPGLSGALFASQDGTSLLVLAEPASSAEPAEAVGDLLAGLGIDVESSGTAPAVLAGDDATRVDFAGSFANEPVEGTAITRLAGDERYVVMLVAPIGALDAEVLHTVAASVELIGPGT